ncbi:ABC transporter permease [Nocardioides carbamazepini]|uniref:ABC transporter permease n=1 Tax=Nocardioides carbamazepini TaxID=2854259 RepID=UPI002149DE98|nr:ABC transporter permease [Nocardioides carbamazepini]MCR1782459.1 ABC transporter permease [Nocardioides carbamazepini]
MTMTAEPTSTTKVPRRRKAQPDALPTANRGSAVAKNVGLRLIVPAVVLLAWWYTTSRDMVSPLIVPAPGDVWDALDSYVLGGVWNEDILSSARGTLWSFAIGLVLGIVGGSIMAFVASIKTAVYPYILAFQAFPKIAVAPLFVVWLGYGDAPKIIIGASLAVFPVISATMAGLIDVDPDEHNLMRSVGASKRQELRHLRFPRAMSYVFPALDIAVVGALLGVITAEIVGTEYGLGRVITERAAYGDSAAVYAVLIVLAVAGAILHLAVSTLHRVMPRSIVPK